MIIASMGKLMEWLAPSSVNILSPQRPAKASGLSHEVYDQMRRDFMVAGPFVLHDEMPELLAGAWTLVRETLFTGELDRGTKEVIAWSVSLANECPFCIDAHLAAVQSVNGDNQSLANWAKASVKTDNALLDHPPFDTHIAEHLGTLTAFHYLNRVVSVFLDKKLMPVPDALNGTSFFMAKFMMGGLIKKGSRNIAGDSISLLPSADKALAWAPQWAKPSPHIASALAGWSSIVETAAAERINVEILETVSYEINRWQGGLNESLETAYADAFANTHQQHHSALTLSLLSAIAPHRVTDLHIRTAQDSGLSNKDVLTLVAWSAQRAARRCTEWSWKR